MPSRLAPLVAAIAIVGANALALSPIARTVANSFAGTTGEDVMIASAAYGLATAASAALLAPRADRIGPARALRHALVGLALAFIVSALATSLTALCIGQGLAGLAAGVAIPATYARAAEIAPDGKEAQTTGAVLSGWTISMVFGVTLSALVADAAHWRVLHAGLALLALATAVVLPSARISGAANARVGAPASAEPAWRVAYATPMALALLCAAGAFMTAFYGAYAYLGAHLTGALGVSTTEAGLAGLAYGAGFGAAAAFDRALDRLGARRALPLALSGTVLVYIAMAVLAPYRGGLAVAIFCWGLFNHAALTCLLNRLTALAPTRRAALLGLNSSVTYLAVFIGALGFRPIFDLGGLTACALAAAGLTMLAALLALARPGAEKAGRASV